MTGAEVMDAPLADSDFFLPVAKGLHAIRVDFLPIDSPDLLAVATTDRIGEVGDVRSLALQRDFRLNQSGHLREVLPDVLLRHEQFAVDVDANDFVTYILGDDAGLVLEAVHRQVEFVGTFLSGPLLLRRDLLLGGIAVAELLDGPPARRSTTWNRARSLGRICGARKEAGLSQEALGFKAACTPSRSAG